MDSATEKKLCSTVVRAIVGGGIRPRRARCASRRVEDARERGMKDFEGTRIEVNFTRDFRQGEQSAGPAAFAPRPNRE